MPWRGRARRASGAEDEDEGSPFDSALSDSGALDSGGDTALPAAELVFDGARPRNLVWISVDTLRRDHVGGYSDVVRSTPQLDAFLREGVALRNHRSCAPWTYPSMACAMSGAYGFETGFIPGPQDPFPDEIELLAERLSSAGYATRLVGAQPFLEPAINLVQGFDEVQVDPYAPAGALAGAIEHALDDLRVGGDPWFLHVHYHPEDATVQQLQAALEATWPALEASIGRSPAGAKGMAWPGPRPGPRPAPRSLATRDVHEHPPLTGGDRL